MKATHKCLKLNFYGGISNPLSLPRSFLELQGLIENELGLSSREVKALRIFYLDDEQDKISIENSFDYQQATNFMEIADINLLEIFLTDDTNIKNFLNFEMINDEDNAVSIHCRDKTLDKTGNKNPNYEDFILQSMNEFVLSTDFAKSVLFSPEKESEVDSHREECNEIIKNIEEKLTFEPEEKSSEKVLEKRDNLKEKESVVDSHNEECNELIIEEKLTSEPGEKSSEKVLEKIDDFQEKETVVDSHHEECNEFIIEEKLAFESEEKSSEKVSEKIDNLEGKIHDEPILEEKTSKEFDLFEFLVNKIKEVPQFEEMIEYIMHKQGEEGINKSNKLTVEKVKKKVRNKIAKVVSKQLDLTEIKILSSLYAEADKVKEKIRNKIAKVVREQLYLTGINILSSLYPEADKEVEKLFNSNSLNKKENIKIDSTAIHKDIRCDGCNKKPIEGSRFKCSVCEDFDYCEECEEKNNDSHPHYFIKIREPELEPTKIFIIIHENPPKSSGKPNKLYDKVENYKEKFMKFTKNVSNDINVLIENIKPQCQKLYNDLKPSKNFYEIFDCRNVKETSRKEANTSQKEEVKNLSAKCLTSNLIISTVNNSNEIRKSIKLVNDGAYPWPKYCYFTCLEEESAVKGQNVPIKIKVDPGKEINIEVVLSLKQIKEEGSYQSIWQLQNEKRENFGEKVVIELDAKFPKDLRVDIEFQQISKEVFPKERRVKTTGDLLKEIQPVMNQNLICKVKSNYKEEINYTNLMNRLKSENNLIGIGDNQILYALVRAKGNKEIALENLFSATNFCDYHPKHFN